MRFRSHSLMTATMVAFAQPALAQAPTSPEKLATYRFNVTVPIFECALDGTKVAGASTIQAPSGAQFVYIDTVNPVSAANAVAQAVSTEAAAQNPVAVMAPVAPRTSDGRNTQSVVIQFLWWLGDTAEDALKRATYNTSGDRRFGTRKTFCVEKRFFDGTTERTYATGRASTELAAGILVLPIKMRLSGSGRAFDFSRDVTLGTVVGPRWRRSPTRDVYLSLLGGAGITAVTLNSASTNGTVTESTDRAAVTLTAGLMLDVNRFQIGLMTGIDKISNPNQEDWIYQGKPWISIGLGYSLLQAASNTPAKDQ